MKCAQIRIYSFSAFSESYSNLVHAEEAILLQEEGSTDATIDQTKLQQTSNEPCQENTPNHINPREQLLNNRNYIDSDPDRNHRNHQNHCSHNRPNDSVAYHALSSSAFSLNHHPPSLHNNQASYDATFQSPSCSHEVELYNRSSRRPRSMFIDCFNSSNDQLNQTAALKPDQVMVVVGDNNANRIPVNDYRTGIVVMSPSRHQNTNGYLPTENDLSTSPDICSANTCSNSRRCVYLPPQLNSVNGNKVGSISNTSNGPGVNPPFLHPRQRTRNDQTERPISKYAVGQNATVEFHV